MGANRSPGCAGCWLEPIPKLGDVGIDVRSPGCHKWLVIFKWVGNSTKRGVWVVHLDYRIHIAVKSLNDVSTFDVKIQQSNGLV